VLMATYVVWDHEW